MLTKQALRAAILAVATFSASPGMAAKAFIFTSFIHPGPSLEAPGFATAEVSNANIFGQANGYEFKGGIGVSAFAAASGRAFDNVQTVGSASLSDSFRVVGTSALAELGAAIFQLDVPIIASGSATAGGGGDGASSLGAYSYSWTVGGQGGSGGLDVRSLENGETTRTVNGGGIARTEFVSLFVRPGESVAIGFSAFANATATSIVGRGSSGTADFGHTLRWGGVRSIQARDAAGKLIALPDGFRLSLLSDQSGFDYFDAAGPNPFTSAVPEPASWALMIAGFGFAGAAARRRRAALGTA